MIEFQDSQTFSKISKANEGISLFSYQMALSFATATIIIISFSM